MSENTFPDLLIPSDCEIPLSNQSIDCLSILDDFCQNIFDGNDIDPAVAKTESDFYKGAPPQWPNFLWAEKQASPLVMRDGYEKIMKQIQKIRQKNCSVGTIKLVHQPGSGGSTLAMQVLWDLRKELKCTTLKDVTSDTKDIANQVINLFEKECPQGQSTVLLLLDNKVTDNNLAHCLSEEIAKRRISANIPVAILLNTVRVNQTSKKNAAAVILNRKLTPEELSRSKRKEEEIREKHGEKLKRFHSFNLMQRDFCEEYVEEVISIETRKYLQENKTSRNTELFSILALVNAYSPGSYLSLSRCQEFLGPPDSIDGQLPFEERMQPFTDLLVTFSKGTEQDHFVRMAHPMIGKKCVQLLAVAGVTRSDTTLNFLESFCRKQEPPFLVKIIKDLLIKRKMEKDKQEKFSKLILDIMNEKVIEEKSLEVRRLVVEGLVPLRSVEKCAQLFRVASDKFEKDAFFPQALARFYYIEMSDYQEAERWAVIAIDRDPNNSFIKDTLGQIHKNHLSRVKSSTLEILQVADLAIKAFKEEEKAAENEQGSNRPDGHAKKFSNIFNSRGSFGYLQVAKLIFDSLTQLDIRWYDVLTLKTSADSLSEAEYLLKYKPLITSLRDEVESKFEFFENYLTYSKPSISKDEPPFFQSDVDACYSKYLLRHSLPTMSPPTMANSFSWLLSCLDRNYSATYLEQITKYWKEIHTANKSDVNAAQNYIVANIILCNKAVKSQVLLSLPDLKDILRRFLEDRKTNHSPEFYLLVLLLFWLDEKQDQDTTYSPDLNEFVIYMEQSFGDRYKKYLRSRYLMPLFFRGHGEGLDSLIHRSKIDELITQDNILCNEKWASGDVWNNSHVQNLLLRAQGVVRNQQVFAKVTDKEIQVFPHHQASVWRPGPVSFYLGFNIKGPVAYDIKHSNEHYKHSLGSQRSCETCANMKDSTHWELVEPSVQREEMGISNYRLSSNPGRYECTVSGVRWVCACKVSLQYQFSNWELFNADLDIIQYTPCGPLMDITVISGELEEVHLPHFACLGSDPSLRDAVRVLHVQDSGVSLEECEVTRFHAKLLHPSFSPMGVLWKRISKKQRGVHCDLLLYRTRTAHLTLRVYLFPTDPTSVQAVKKQENEFNGIKILKPSLDMPLKMKNRYKLATSCVSDIEPEEGLHLRHSRTTTPNFFEVYIKDAETDISMSLTSGQDKKPVWKTQIRQDQYNEPSKSHGDHSKSSVSHAAQFVDRHRKKIIERVTVVEPIADDMLSHSLISHRKYTIIMAPTTSGEKMTVMYDILHSGGGQMKAEFYKILQDHEGYLVEDLAESGS